MLILARRYDSGKEAFLRTKQILDEAATVSSMLFIDEEDMADRYRRAYAKQEGEEAMETEPSVIGRKEISVGEHPPGTTSIFKTGLFGGATDSSVRADGTAGALITSSRLSMEEPVERRPEERKFCELFIDLLELKVSVEALFKHTLSSGIVGQLRSHRSGAIQPSTPLLQIVYQIPSLIPSILNPSELSEDYFFLRFGSAVHARGLHIKTQSEQTKIRRFA